MGHPVYRRRAIVVIAVQPNNSQTENVCINSCGQRMIHRNTAGMNQALSKVLIADVLLRLNTILRQIAFLLNLLMRSRLRIEYRTTWSKTCTQGRQLKAMLLRKLELRTLFVFLINAFDTCLTVT